MIAVLGIVAPIFALIGLGAGARYWRVLDTGGLKGLSDLTFYLAIPALLFGAVVESQSSRLLDVALLYFGVAVSVFGVGVLLGRQWLGMGLAQSSMLGLNASYGNTVMMGVPLVSAAFGPEGLAILLPVIVLQSVLLLPLATILIEAEGRGTANPWRIVRATLPALVRNPIIVALLAAFVWRGLGVPVPGALHALLAMLGGAAPTLALFSLGATLPDFAAQGSVRETGVASALKLVVQPALVWGVAALAGFGALTTAVVVVTAGVPTGANAFFLARRSNVSAAASAGTVVVATAASVVTLSLLLAALRP